MNDRVKTMQIDSYAVFKNIIKIELQREID
jgi:hypothetical protein